MSHAIEFNVEGHRVRRTDKTDVVAGSSMHYTVEASFDAEWDGFSRRVSFENATNVFGPYDYELGMTVPSNAVDVAGPLRIVFTAVSPDGTEYFSTARMATPIMVLPSDGGLDEGQRVDLVDIVTQARSGMDELSGKIVEFDGDFRAAKDAWSESFDEMEGEFQAAQIARAERFEEHQGAVEAYAAQIGKIAVTATNDARSVEASARSAANASASAINSASSATTSANHASSSAVKAEQARQRADAAADGSQAAIDEAISGMGDAIDAAVDAAVGGRVDAVVETANAAASLAATSAGQASGMALRASQSAAAADESADLARQAASDLRAAAERGDFDGTDGVSPTATVSKSGRTTTITLTDKDGTTTAEVLDGIDGAGAVQDVTVAGASCVVDGVAEIPYGTDGGARGVVRGQTPNGIAVDAYGTMRVVKATDGQVDAHAEQMRPIVPGNLVRAVNSVLCSTAATEQLTAEQQSAARARLDALGGQFEMIADVVLAESGQQVIDITKDMAGGDFRLMAVLILSEFTVSSSSASSYYFVQMSHTDKPLTTVALPDGSKGVKYYRRMLSTMVGGRWLHTMTGSTNIAANNANFGSPAMLNQLYGAGLVNRLYINGTFEAGSNMRIYAIRG